MQPETLAPEVAAQNSEGLREFSEAVARLEASEPGSKEWKNALEQAEEGVEWLQLLEATHYSPGSEADDESALVITDEEHNALVSALAGIKPRLESTGPNTDERRQAIEDANAVIEDALYGGEDD